MNWIGLGTLLAKEVHRFSKVALQTVVSPLISTSLYFLVFGVALGARLREVQGIPYIEFVVPGLVMLAMINASFLNTSSSIFQAKINGTILDILVAPLGAREFIVAFLAAAALRSLLVGALVFIVAFIFNGMGVAHPLYTLLFSLMVSATFAAFGILVAIWAEKYDHLAAVPNFVLTPLTFLGGVFYSVEMLPHPWDTVSRLNPILYMVNGMRYGLLDRSDVSPGVALGVVSVGLLTTVLVTWRVVASGYKLRT